MNSEIAALMFSTGFAIWLHYYAKFKLDTILRRRSIRKQNRLRYQNMGY